MSEKSTRLLFVSVVSVVASALLFFRAETIRWTTNGQWTHPPESLFAIYSTFDSRWFWEDYAAVLLFVTALGTLIYGMYLRKKANEAGIGTASPHQ